MKVIIEGCDGTGKTTVAKLLADKYGLDICHCTRDDPSDFDFYRQTIRKENVVWDRHTIGELIYPSVFGRKGMISPEDARIILAYGREAGAKVLVLTSPIDIIRNRLIERNNECKEVLDKLAWIDEQFRFYANRFCIPIIDTSKITMQELFNIVESPEQISFIHK